MISSIAILGFTYCNDLSSYSNLRLKFCSKFKPVSRIFVFFMTSTGPCVYLEYFCQGSTCAYCPATCICAGVRCVLAKALNADVAKPLANGFAELLFTVLISLFPKPNADAPGVPDVKVCISDVASFQFVPQLNFNISSILFPAISDI